MPDRAQYLANADYCAQMAAATRDPATRRAYRVAEKSWRALAEAANVARIIQQAVTPPPRKSNS